MITSIKEMYQKISKDNPITIAVAQAADSHVLEAVLEAHQELGINAVLIGNQTAIEETAQDSGLDITFFKIIHVDNERDCAKIAVQQVTEKKADIIMKGLMQSSDFLKAIISRSAGLRDENAIISAIAVVELKKLHRLIFITDLGFTPLPDLDTKIKLTENAVNAAKAFGIKEPKVALLSASETVNNKMISSTEAATLQEMNDQHIITGCKIAGPISFDLALSPESVIQKGYKNPVGGKADILVVPSIEVGNTMYKALSLFSDMETGGIMTGAKVPIVFCSRADTAETKKNTIAMAVFMAQNKGR